MSDATVIEFAHVRAVAQAAAARAAGATVYVSGRAAAETERLAELEAAQAVRRRRAAGCAALAFVLLITALLLAVQS